MAKDPGSKKKDVPEEVFGQVNKDGTVSIDPEKLEEFKKKLESLSKHAWSNVRFVARNAPFKRRSPIPPA